MRPITSSWPATAQPPCAKPLRVSSSGPAGACITPSSVRWLTTRILMFAPFESGLTLYTNGIGPDRQLRVERRPIPAGADPLACGGDIVAHGGVADDEDGLVSG